MISDIFNSILFGELRPWHKDFSDEKLISGILKQAPAFNFGNALTLHSRIKGILKEHPALWQFPENNLLNSQPLSIEPIYDLHIAESL